MTLANMCLARLLPTETTETQQTTNSRKKNSYFGYLQDDCLFAYQYSCRKRSTTGRETAHSWQCKLCRHNQTNRPMQDNFVLDAALSENGEKSGNFVEQVELVGIPTPSLFG